MQDQEYFWEIKYPYNNDNRVGDVNNKITRNAIENLMGLKFTSELKNKIKIYLNKNYIKYSTGTLERFGYFDTGDVILLYLGDEYFLVINQNKRKYYKCDQ